jgi:hypothetical protein
MNFDDPKNVRQYLHFFTNHFYSFAVASSRVWTDLENVEYTDYDQPFYQLMPDTIDDGYFYWYCHIRPNNQFLKTKEMCILYFIKYWMEWIRQGKPDWETEIIDNNI